MNGNLCRTIRRTIEHQSRTDRTNRQRSYLMVLNVKHAFRSFHMSYAYLPCHFLENSEKNLKPFIKAVVFYASQVEIGARDRLKSQLQIIMPSNCLDICFEQFDEQTEQNQPSKRNRPMTRIAFSKTHHLRFFLEKSYAFCFLRSPSETFLSCYQSTQLASFKFYQRILVDYSGIPLNSYQVDG